jgi:hypothetical protein
VEGHGDDDGRDCHVHGELQVRQEGCFVLAPGLPANSADTEAYWLETQRRDKTREGGGGGGLRLTSLVGAVVARIAALVLKEQRAKGRPGEEDG